MADMETHLDDEGHLCEDCHKPFASKSDFEVHLCIQTGECSSLCTLEKRLHCCLCGKKFDTSSRLAAHMNIHTGGKPYICPHCHFKSSSSYYINLHIIRTHTKDFKHNCSFCCKGFVLKSELTKHIQRFHPSEETNESVAVKKEKVEPDESKKQADQMHCCSHCSYVTNIKGNLVSHLWTHSSNRPYQCQLCNKGYIKKNQLADHLRTHTGERPFVCNTCGRGYSSKTILRIHERYHPEEAMYLKDPSKSRAKPKTKVVKNNELTVEKSKEVHQCSFCNKTFSKEAHFMAHVRGHTEERFFECNACEKAFSTKAYLKKHKCSKDSSERDDVMHRCPFCPFSASRKFSLKIHMQTHSSNEKEMCNLCKRVVSNKATHLETCRGSQLLQCKHCYSFFNQSDLMKHYKVCKEKHPFTCGTCGRGFFTLSYWKFHESLHSTSQVDDRKTQESTLPEKKEIPDPTCLSITKDTEKQTLLLQKSSTVNSQSGAIQNQFLILQPTLILNEN